VIDEIDWVEWARERRLSARAIGLHSTEPVRLRQVHGCRSRAFARSFRTPPPAGRPASLRRDLRRCAVGGHATGIRETPLNACSIDGAIAEPHLPPRCSRRSRFFARVVVQRHACVFDCIDSPCADTHRLVRGDVYAHGIESSPHAPRSSRGAGSAREDLAQRSPALRQPTDAVGLREPLVVVVGRSALSRLEIRERERRLPLHAASAPRARIADDPGSAPVVGRQHARIARPRRAPAPSSYPAATQLESAIDALRCRVVVAASSAATWSHLVYDRADIRNTTGSAERSRLAIRPLRRTVITRRRGPPPHQR